MKKNKKKNISIPCLALEARPNSFTPINLFDLDLINKLKNQGINIIGINTLIDLDYILAYFTKQEIISSINNSNIIPFELDEKIPMVILFDGRKLPLISKEDTNKLGISELLDLIFENPALLNIYKNKYEHLFRKYYANHISGDAINQLLVGFHDALNSKSKIYLENQFNALFYTFRREMIFYMNEMVEKNRNRGIPLERKKESGEV